MKHPLLVAALIGGTAIFFGGNIFQFIEGRGSRDLVVKGYSQEQLLRSVSSETGITFPNDVYVVDARTTGGKDPTWWYVLTSPQKLDRFIENLENDGYKSCDWTVVHSPRALPREVRAVWKLADDSHSISLVRSKEPNPAQSGVWILLNQRKTALLVCKYSS